MLDSFGKSRNFLPFYLIFSLFIFYSQLQGDHDQSKPISLNKIDLQFLDIIDEKVSYKIPLINQTKSLTSRIEPLFLDRDGSERYGVIIYTDQPHQIQDAGIQINSILPHFITAHITPQSLINLVHSEAVHYIDMAEILYPMNDISLGWTGADLLHSGFVNNTSYRGSGVLVCIIDSGIDWEHEDFRDPDDPTQSRILFIWDQTISPQAGETSPTAEGFVYGVEYTNVQIEDEINGITSGFVREQDILGHGTHVAGIAAGNGASLSNVKYKGMAPEAELVVVKSGNGSFPMNRIIDGLIYANKKAESLGRPLVVNLSLGSDYGPHDGTNALDQAIDNFCSSGSGRAVAVSAGNSGDDEIHLSGSIDGGSFVEIFFQVPSYSARTGINNDDFEFDLWFDGTEDIRAEFYSPNDSVSQSPDGVVTKQTNDGTLRIYNTIDFNNNNREVRAEAYDAESLYPPQSGTWKLKLINNSATTVNFHGWLYDQTVGTGDLPVSLVDGDTEYTLGNTASDALIVGSYVHRWRWTTNSGSSISYAGTDRSDDISSFSSIGPTRTMGQKPDITAPGQGIGSSLSQNDTVDWVYILPGSKHRINQGTSMSSPVVAGAVALLFEAHPNLTASDIKTLITTNGNTDSFTGSVWNQTWGYGRLDIYKAIKKVFDSGTVVNREFHIYDDWGSSNSTLYLESFEKIALRFIPSFNGGVTGFFLHTAMNLSITSPMLIEIWSDDGSGLPDTKLSLTYQESEERLLPYSWNFIGFGDSSYSVIPETDYHLVVYHNSAGNSLTLARETNSLDNHCSLYNGSLWHSYAYDVRIRPVITSHEGILTQVKIFLEGNYNPDTDSMTSVLGDHDLIPLTSPYTPDQRSVGSVPLSISDWILLQLRSSATGEAIESKSVLLRKDGFLVADNGLTTHINLDTDPGEYFVVLEHRNHIPVMSRMGITLNHESGNLINFTTDSTKFYGSNGAKELEEGVWGMWGGDVNQDGEVTSLDYVKWFNTNRLGQSGYDSADINMDGEISKIDYEKWIDNSILGASSQLP